MNIKQITRKDTEEREGYKKEDRKEWRKEQINKGRGGKREEKEVVKNKLAGRKDI